MPDAATPQRFPFITAFVTLAALFLFVGLVLLAYNSPNYLGGEKVRPVADPNAKLNDVRARNRAVLDGEDPAVRFSNHQAMAEVLAHAAQTKDAANPEGRLPFPVPPPTPEKKP